MSKLVREDEIDIVLAGLQMLGIRIAAGDLEPHYVEMITHGAARCPQCARSDYCSCD